MEPGLLFVRDLAVVLLVAAAIGSLFRRLGLSVVVGYLVAGMVIGPFTPPFTLVSDIERIHTLSELGLVFLMFFIGMELSLGRLRQLGFSLLATVAVTAWLVFHCARLFAGAAGWTPTAGLFLGAMLMVSSSAILTKTLSQAGMNHEKFGRRALGMSLMEDIVAVVMLTVLTTKVGSESASPTGIFHVLGRLGSFVALLIALGLLIVPRLLKRLARDSDNDLKVSIVAGVLLFVAYLAASAGYSVALGAFLLGMIVGETAFRERIERAFTGVQGMFVTVFFVSIGMLIDIRLLAHHWVLILGVALFSIVLRTVCASFALLLAGSTLNGAIRTAVVVTPIGEFSYIIAQLGVSKGAVPDFFYGLAVGVSAITAFTAPLLLRSSEPLAAWIERHQPNWLRRSLFAYRSWLDALGLQLKGNNFWVLTRGRIGQVLMEILLLLGILGFSPMIHDAVLGLPSSDVHTAVAVPPLSIAFWGGIFFICLVLAVAIWRNVAAMAMIFAEATLPRSSSASLLRPVLEGGIQFAAAAGLIGVFWALFPLPLSGWWNTGVVLLGVALFLFLFWRRLVRWYSQFQVSVSSAFGVDAARSAVSSSKSVQDEDWGVDLVEVTVPEDVSYAGQSIRDLGLRQRFGATVVSIERHGFEIPNPNPDLAFYPGDKLLVLGDDASVGRARAFLEESSGAVTKPSFGESSLETVLVPPSSPRFHHSLADLRIFTATGVQVLGLRRGGATVLNPPAAEVLLPGDRLLILATPGEYRAFRDWLLG